MDILLGIVIAIFCGGYIGWLGGAMVGALILIPRQITDSAAQMAVIDEFAATGAFVGMFLFLCVVIYETRPITQPPASPKTAPTAKAQG